VQNEVSIVRALVAEARGTAGRLMFDQAIPRQLEQVERELGTLLEDVRRNPQRYLIH
jgi:hypothetical protein